MSLVVSGPGTGPLVRSKADPSPNALRTLRALLQRRPDLRELFTQFRTGNRPVEWLRDMLTARVAVELEDLRFEEVLEVCQYLADEFQQLACVPGCQLDDGWFVLDQDSGRTVAVAGPGDIYRAGLVPREFGGCGEALPRLDPALEARLTAGLHERARERESLAWLAERARGPLALGIDDPMLWLASRSGRTSIARELSEEDPLRLFWSAGGRALHFLKHLSKSNIDTANLVAVDGVACCRTVIGIQDPRTTSILFDALGSLRRKTGLAWVAAVARQLGYVAKEGVKSAVPMAADDLTDATFDSAETWVTDADTYGLLGPQVKCRTYLVDGAETYGLRDLVGKLDIGADFGVETRELSDRWEVTATVSYTLHVDLKKVQLLPLVGVARAAEQA